MDQQTRTPVGTIDAPPGGTVVADDPEEIRRQIIQTRHNMARTINQIQEQISPEALRQQAEDSLREAAAGKVEDMAQRVEYQVDNWRSNVMRTVRENPVPSAMLGIGLGWLIISGARDRNGYDEENGYERYGRYERYGPYERDYRAAAFDPRYESGLAHQRYYRGMSPEEEESMMAEARERATSMAEEAGEWASDVAEDAREWVDEATDRVSEMTGQTRERAAQARTSAEERASSVADTARERGAEMRESLAESAHEAEARARRARQKMEWQARYRARRARRTFVETMNENPLAVGVAALAAGALVGLVLPGTEKEDELMGPQRDRLLHEARMTAEETAERVQSVVEESRDAAMERAREEAKKQDLPVPEDKS